MQPQPTELQPQHPYIALSDLPKNTTQHGIHSNESHTPEENGDSTSSSHDPTPLDSSDASPPPGEELEGRRLKTLDNRGKRPKPSAQLIAEYENAMLPTRQEANSEGPEFKIVKRKVINPNATQLDDFPNGTVA